MPEILAATKAAGYDMTGVVRRIVAGGRTPTEGGERRHEVVVVGLPSFPDWLIDGTRPSRLAWLLKERMLPLIYWKAMLRGKEWMATPQLAA